MVQTITNRFVGVLLAVEALSQREAFLLEKLPQVFHVELAVVVGVKSPEGLHEHVAPLLTHRYANRFHELAFTTIVSQLLHNSNTTKKQPHDRPGFINLNFIAGRFELLFLLLLLFGFCFNKKSITEIEKAVFVCVEFGEENARGRLVDVHLGSAFYSLKRRENKKCIIYLFFDLSLNLQSDTVTNHKVVQNLFFKSQSNVHNENRKGFISKGPVMSLLYTHIRKQFSLRINYLLGKKALLLVILRDAVIRDF
jgi:hypothetical protein